jgi:hypothetical protein
VESVESVSAHVIRDSVEVELRGFVVVEFPLPLASGLWTRDVKWHSSIYGSLERRRKTVRGWVVAVDGIRRRVDLVAWLEVHGLVFHGCGL